MLRFAMHTSEGKEEKKNDQQHVHTEVRKNNSEKGKNETKNKTRKGVKLYNETICNYYY